MYMVESVAKYIIDYSCDKGKTVSNLRLQKILYFVQAEFIVSRKCPCFRDAIQAWNFGPVVPAVYYKYKIYGGASIPSTGTKGKAYDIPEDDMKIIREIVDQCNKYSTSYLVQLTHNQDPWKNAIAISVGHEISIDSIRKYFSEE